MAVDPVDVEATPAGPVDVGGRGVVHAGRGVVVQQVRRQRGLVGLRPPPAERQVDARPVDRLDEVDAVAESGADEAGVPLVVAVAGVVHGGVVGVRYVERRRHLLVDARAGGVVDEDHGRPHLRRSDELALGLVRVLGQHQHRAAPQLRDELGGHVVAGDDDDDVGVEPVALGEQVQCDGLAGTLERHALTGGLRSDEPLELRAEVEVGGGHADGAEPGHPPTGDVRHAVVGHRSDDDGTHQRMTLVSERTSWRSAISPLAALVCSLACVHVCLAG